MANSVLAKLAVQISANTAQFNKSLKESSSNLSKFQNSITGAVKSIGVAFALSQIGSFILDITKLAGEAKGVKEAFDKLPDSIRLMRELKSATAGTVSELDLMKQAVQASNFGITLEALPKLLEFAAVRAKQTGQSVEFLSQSIVTGIGRKSLLILDNLGLSAVRINEELAKTPDYATAIGNIAASELEKMGKISENAATSTERLSASFNNFKVAVGNVANDTGIYEFAINKLAIGLEKAATALGLLNKESERGAQTTWDAKPVDNKADSIENIKNLTEELKVLQENQTILTGEQLAITNREIKSIEDKIKKLRELGVELSKQAQLEKQAALNRIKNLQFSGGPTVAGFDRSTLSFEKPDDKSIAAMTNAQNALADATARANAEANKQKDIIIQQREAFANMAISIGDSIGSSIANQESFAQVMVRTTQTIVDQIQKRVIANIISGASSLFAANPILGIGVVGLAGGIIKGLLGKLGGSGGGGGSVGSSRPQFSRASVGMVQSSVVVTGTIRGQDIYLSNQNYQKASGYTKG